MKNLRDIFCASAESGRFAMHKSAMMRMSWFVDNYVKGKGKVRVLDVGSYNVNGCLRPLFEDTKAEYVGLDIEAGPNVDVVMSEPYNWSNIPDESFDFVVSANAFEHIEYPWLTIKQIYNKLKPEGFACVIAPNSTPEHRYPFDCYRYFADGFNALGKWGGFQVINVTVSGVPAMNISRDWDSLHNDVCMILLKSDKTVNLENYPMLKYERRVNIYSEHSSVVKIVVRKMMPRTYAFLKVVKNFLKRS